VPRIGIVATAAELPSSAAVERRNSVTPPGSPAEVAGRQARWSTALPARPVRS